MIIDFFGKETFFPNDMKPFNENPRLIGSYLSDKKIKDEVEASWVNVDLEWIGAEASDKRLTVKYKFIYDKGKEILLAIAAEETEDEILNILRTPDTLRLEDSFEILDKSAVQC